MSFLISFTVWGADHHDVGSGASSFISEWGICATVTNSSPQTLFVPTKTESEWKTFLTSPIPNVSKSIGTCTCNSYKVAGNNSDGIYSIDPDGAGANAPFDAYCDMNTNGGGWTLIARSVSGSSSPSFGWQYDTGSPHDDSQCYSVNVVSKGLPFTRIMLGENTGGKSWGSYVYSKVFSLTDVIVYGTSEVSLVVTPVIGGNGSFAMARHIGHTTNNGYYHFRDVPGLGTYGLHCGVWSAGYADDSPSPGYNGYMNGRQAMIMVK